MYPYKAAALDFSNATGIQVSDTWGLTDHKLIQDCIRPVAKDYDQSFVDKLYDQFDLPAAKTPFDRYHAVMGMVSQYNYDDIEYFLQVPSNKRNPRMKDREAVIEYKTGTSIFWVASSKTFDKIEKALSIGKFQQPMRRNGHQHSAGRTGTNIPA
jgi:hypothetical protein